MKFNANLRKVFESTAGDVVLAVDTEYGPGIVIKTNEKTGRSITRKNGLIHFEPQLFLHPNAAVFRLYVQFGNPVLASLDTYLDPGSPFDLNVLHRICLANLMRFYVVDHKLNAIGARGLPLASSFQLRMVNLVCEAIDHNDRVKHRDYPLALRDFSERIKKNPDGGDKEII